MTPAPLANLLPRRSVAAAIGLLAALLLTASVSTPAVALSAPAHPSGVTVAATTSTSFTVTADPAARATGYRLYASTTRSSVYVANISRAQRSARVTTPRAALAGLVYSTASWYYRLGASNGAGTRYSAIFSTHLLPGTPTAPAITSSVGGTSLSWASGPALGFRITRATDPTLTAGRVDFAVSSQAHQYTPYGLVPGTRYYFRVAAANDTVRSAYSPTVTVVAVPHEQAVQVMTYNVLASTTAGTVEGDGPLASWAQRRSGVAHLIRSAAPDVVAVQEGNGWVGPVQGYGGVRQVDDLVTLLKTSAGSGYALAATEVPPTQHGYLRTGRYILYRTAAYRAEGAGGHWSIGTDTAQRWAAYQVLVNRTTGARFVFVSVHLSYLAGTAGDTQRQTETRSLLQQATAYGKAQHAPVVYAGDFNSHGGSNHTFDGPGLEFRAAHATDALEVARITVNGQYDSANQNLRTPPAFGRSIDHVYAPAGVALRTWSLGLELTDGKFAGVIPSDHNPLSVEAVVPW